MMKILSKNRSTNSKKNEIWRGIVHKAQMNGDHSLDEVSETTQQNFPRFYFIAGAAVLLICFSLSILMDQIEKVSFIDEQELSTIFSDPNSTSRLILSTGDTVSLDNLTSHQARLLGIYDEKNILDFRDFGDKNIQGEIQVIETGRGKRTGFVLSDGTKVWLNAMSKIEFPAHFLANERVVKITGEAYFEVEEDINRPFIVKLEDKQVKVLGTHFNVRDYFEDTENNVTLLEGRVEVASLQDLNKKAILKPSYQLSENNEGKFEITQLTDPSSVLAWKDDMFYFEDANTEIIVKELERWYPVSILITKQDTTKKISGRIKRTDSMKEVVDMLQFFDINIAVKNN